MAISSAKAVATAKAITTPETITSAKAVTSAEAIASTKAVTAAKPIAPTKAVAAPKTVATSEAVAATAAAKPIAAATWSARRGGLGRAGVDAVNRDDLQSARRILKIAYDRRALGQILLPMRNQGRRMAERIAAIVQRDEAIAFGGIEPFNRALHRRHCEGPRAVIVEVRHEIAELTCRCTDDGRARTSGDGRSATTAIFLKLRPNRNGGGAVIERPQELQYRRAPADSWPKAGFYP
jgi:hypothetical protein